ncbi:ribonuclease HII [Thermoplasma sp. Kam2015]|uniref:ribonuclease HII n=1 Tax=Thermoplasma sp. Kam2015 TaxID=2094122 RepID=UPI000D8FE09F|nr:ribonuclease HII [Thermoplasma sp. Kam2015]PYB67567.1 ribonuclease HII [Thermoplasma sp. Kam2015]
MEAEIQCGIDEAGRGPVIGPMVISIVCCDTEFLKGIGVKDSKVLSRKRRSEIFKSIMDRCHVRYRILSPEEINRMMSMESLNKIEEDEIIELLEYAESTVYIDCYDVIEERAQEAIERRSGKKVVCRHKADAIFPAVSAASIVSKVLRDAEIDKLHEKYGDFGSGYPSDPRTIEFLYGFLKNAREPEKIVRMHWSTVGRIIDEIKNQKKLF